jgi:hypothetical protein
MTEPPASETPKQRLDAVARLVIKAVSRLKIGDEGTVPIDRFTPSEVRGYLWGWAEHKGRWFDSEYDKTIKAFRVKRVVPKLEDISNFDDEEEVS